MQKIHGIQFDAYDEAYQHCQQIHSRHPYDYYGMTTTDDLESQSSQKLTTSTTRMCPRKPDLAVKLVSHRRMPVKVVQRQLNSRVVFLVAVQFYRNPKSRERPGGAIQTEVDYASPLNSEQLAVWHIFRRHCCHVKNGREPPPILMYVDGAGGTGKPFVINAVSEVLEAQLPGSVENQPVSVRNEMRDFKYVILDEKSMISLHALHLILACARFTQDHMETRHLEALL
ncbi:hypothetical protein E4U44_002543 [Claviceps purpurea]|nr:hypothetical protein E4U44_002543 [Claviceps purpurea]